MAAPRIGFRRMAEGRNLRFSRPTAGIEDRVCLAEACFTSRTILRCSHEGGRWPSKLLDRSAIRSGAARAEIRDAMAPSATRPRAQRPSLDLRRAQGWP